MMISEMKKNWEVKTLSELTTLLGDGLHGTPKYTDDGEYYFVNGNNLVNGKIIFKDNTKRVSVDEYTKYKKNLTDRTVLVSINGTLGNVAFYNNEKVMLGKSACYFNLLDTVDKKYIKYIISSQYFLDYVHREATGATIKNVSLKTMRAFKVPIPPIPEQKRIVSLLDTVFADLEQTRAKTEQNLKNARELFDSYLQLVFNQLGENCTIRSMSDKSMLSMIDGDRGKNYPKKSEFQSEGHCLFLSTKNVRPDGFLFDQTMFIDESRDSLLRKGKLERNDVVVTTRGTIGNLALFDESIEYNNIRINSGMLILRPNIETILPSYLFEIMRSGIVRKQIDEKVSGAAQPQLPVNTLNTFSFPVPVSLEEQKHTVDLIRKAELEINELTNIYTRKLNAIDELKKSILQKAFSGELTAEAK
tara:strand:+ start:15598 stop:16848 length:1251 start_codon:yes stop_codon:yes gene_type:complete